MWHYCLPDGRQESFLCPIGTLFNQRHFICDWWYNTNCTASQELYRLNDILYERYTESRTSKAPKDSRTQEDSPSADGSLSSSSTSEGSYEGQGLQEAFGERERGEGSPLGFYGLPEESPKESYGLREESPKESYDHPRDRYDGRWRRMVWWFVLRPFRPWVVKLHSFSKAKSGDILDWIFIERLTKW